MEGMVPIVVPIAVIWGVAVAIVAVTAIISHGRILRRAIDSGATPDLIASIAAADHHRTSIYASLRWAFVIGAMGIAHLIIQFLPYRADAPFMYGIILVFGAVGSFMYYTIARRLEAT